MQAPIKKAYKAVMSSKVEIKIDPEEIEIVLNSAAQGRLIKTKQGVINPSFLVAIVEDEDRMTRFLHDNKHDPEKRKQGLEPLENIFEKKKPQLPTGSPPQLSGTGGGKALPTGTAGAKTN